MFYLRLVIFVAIVLLGAVAFALGAMWAADAIFGPGTAKANPTVIGIIGGVLISPIVIVVIHWVVEAD